MKKLFVSQELKDFSNLSKRIVWNLNNFTKKIKNRELKSIVLNKKSHYEIIQKIKKMNIHVSLINNGDVMGAIDVVNGDTDFIYGIGGSPEGALVVSLAIASNCKMEWSLKKINEIQTSKNDDPNRYKFKKQQVKKSNFEYEKVYSCYDLIFDKKTMFISSAITAGNTLKGVSYKNNKYIIMSVVASEGVVRNIKSEYNLSKILKYEKNLEFVFTNDK